MVIRFTTVYICTIIDGHEDAVMIFLIDFHALLIFLGGLFFFFFFKSGALVVYIRLSMELMQVKY